MLGLLHHTLSVPSESFYPPSTTYICHSNGIHYDVVLDVLSDTKLAPSNCFSNTCKRKIEQQESDSGDNISIKKKLKVTNVFKSDMHAEQGTESKLSVENFCHADILKNGDTSFGTSKLDSPVDSVCMSSTERPILHEQLKAKTHKSNKNLSDVFKNAGTDINKFHKSINFLVYQCSICQEAWPLKAKPKSPSSYICRRCSLDKQSPKLFSAENFMIPTCVPEVLQGLTQIEEMLIARALPIMKVYIKPGGQRGYSGHCINLPQKVTDLAKLLPRCPKDIPVVVVTMKGKDNTFKDVFVRKNKVEQALEWLIKHNPHYHDVKLDTNLLNTLPVNGIPHNLQVIETNSDPEGISVDQHVLHEMVHNIYVENEDVFDEKTETSSFLPQSTMNEQLEHDAIQNKLGAKIDWPNVGDEPLNEYTTPFLATIAFPCLFPDGKGDPTNPALFTEISLSKKIQHLIKFAEFVDENWVYRFASHPGFSYWALDMIQRKRLLQQSAIFLKQNPEESHLTIDELRDMASNDTSGAFMSRLSRYVSNVTGSSAYWYKVREDLKAIIACKGAPTIFFTFSSADMHWPELHMLLNPSSPNPTSKER